MAGINENVSGRVGSKVNQAPGYDTSKSLPHQREKEQETTFGQQFSGQQQGQQQGQQLQEQQQFGRQGFQDELQLASSQQFGSEDWTDELDFVDDSDEVDGFYAEEFFIAIVDAGPGIQQEQGTQAGRKAGRGRGRGRRRQTGTRRQGDHKTQEQQPLSQQQGEQNIEQQQQQQGQQQQQQQQPEQNIPQQQQQSEEDIKKRDVEITDREIGNQTRGDQQAQDLNQTQQAMPSSQGLDTSKWDQGLKQRDQDKGQQDSLGKEAGQNLTPDVKLNEASKSEKHPWEGQAQATQSQQEMRKEGQECGSCGDAACLNPNEAACKKMQDSFAQQTCGGGSCG